MSQMLTQIPTRYLELLVLHGHKAMHHMSGTMLLETLSQTYAPQMDYLTDDRTAGARAGCLHLTGVTWHE